MADNGNGHRPDMAATHRQLLSEEYREIMRKHNTITILLGQLKSSNIQEVASACMILSNLSANCLNYQKILWDSAAVPVLRTLTQSRHEAIALAAGNALKNLLLSPAKPAHMEVLISPEPAPNCSMPALQARKLKNLKDEIQSTLSDSYDPIEAFGRRHSPMARAQHYLPGRMYTSFSGQAVDPHQVSRSNSHDSIGSTHSEPVNKLTASRPANQNLSALYLLSNEYDYCSEAKAGQSLPSASFVSSVIDEDQSDPLPTDYSRRYQERAVDEFALCEKPDAVGNEDSVKLYMTEGTPLNYSLVSSLTDLREAALNAIDAKPTLADPKSQTSGEQKTAPKVSFKKPVPPPKPNLRNIQKKEVKSLAAISQEVIAEEVNGVDNAKSSPTTDECQQPTPLMYSRTSSLASLSDCDLKSDVCQSSVVSEFSRRQSEAVSPSDLPDSPLDTPPRPVPLTRPMISNSAKPEPELKPSPAVDDKCQRAVNVFEDRAITFATEDTPAVISLSTSLSSLCKSLIEEMETKDTADQTNSDSRLMEDNDCLEVNDISAELISTSSEDEANEDQLLAACISSGMKKSNEKLISYNSLKRTDLKKSAKAISIPQPRKESADESGPPMARSAPDGQSAQRRNESIKAVNSESNGLNSLTDISISGSGNTHNTSKVIDCQTDDSTDDEEILKKCIASGMSAYSHNKSANKTRVSPKTPKTTPNPSPGALTNENAGRDVNPDQTRRFFVEDTPIELTHCHSSLSSLSIVSDEPTDVEQRIVDQLMAKGVAQTNSQTKSSKIPKAMPRMSKMKHNKVKITNLDELDDTNTYTICHKSQRSSDHLMVSSTNTEASGASDLDQTKPPSLMDNSAMFSSTESFSYRPAVREPAVKRSDENLIDNVKPPSIMDEISMSQSCASITSDISEIAFDSEVSHERIAQMASDCVLRIQSMTYSADDSDTDTIDRIYRSTDTKTRTLQKDHWHKHLEPDLSDSELSTEELPVDGSEADVNDVVCDLNTTVDTTALPLESPTICADIHSDFDDRNRTLTRERRLLMNGPRISPIGSEERLIDEQISSMLSDDSELDSGATYNVNSPRRSRLVRPVIRNNKQHNQDIHILTAHLSLSRPTVPSVRNKYTAKQTRTSALRANRSRSAESGHHLVVTDEELIDQPRHVTARKQYNIDIPAESFARQVATNGYAERPLRAVEMSADSASIKAKERSLLSTVKSKLSSSLSSNNLRSSNASLSSNSSNGLTPSCASFSRKLEVQSRIASLWKRSKSIGSSEKSQKQSHSTDKSDLSRSISARRSFGISHKTDRHNHQSDHSALNRSSTYEKLPQTGKECDSMDDTCRYANNNFADKRFGHSTQRSLDKCNGNTVYQSKHEKDVLAKNRINNNHNNAADNRLMRSSSRSGRTCLVTAV